MAKPHVDVIFLIADLIAAEKFPWCLCLLLLLQRSSSIEQEISVHSSARMSFEKETNLMFTNRFFTSNFKM